MFATPYAQATDLKLDQKDMVFLLVDKTHLRADLRSWPEDRRKSELLMSFKIAIGKEEGDKQSEGDNRTPEGIYFTQRVIDGTSLPAKYGPKAIPIDFPNPYDQVLGKTGYGIWLHGVEADQRVEAAKVTEGCVAFYNADIKTLTSWLEPFQAVVLIARDFKVVNQEADLDTVEAQTRSWYESWKARDLDAYVDHYHKDFVLDGRSKERYRDYKEKVFGSYKTMDVNIADLRVFTHEKYAVSIMNQDFNGDKRYVSNGRKVLYWQRDDQGSWKIIRELFDSSRLEFPSFSRAQLAQLFEQSPSFKALSKEVTQTNNL
ncbi:MAG: L,D-transpeptidase family protein [Oligoflexales bacterium]